MGKMSNKSRRASDLPKAAVEALWQGNVIEAIKVVRLEQKIGLKEAKEQVDAYIGSQPALKKKLDQVLATAKERMVRWLIGLLVLVAGIAYFLMQGP
jgi:ribosomal protein L7/L12